MKATLVSYKRGRHLIHPKQGLVKTPGVDDKSKAQALLGKKVIYTTKSGKKITGKVTRHHGNKGLVRARFNKGLPGQAIGSEVELEE